jgi:hypothetical protein
MGSIHEGQEPQDDDYVWDFGIAPLPPIPDLARRRLEAWYVLALLRHHRPNFDNLSAVEQQLLLTKCCERVNEVLKSVRLLSDFLEYGLNDPLQGKIEV